MLTESILVVQALDRASRDCQIEQAIKLLKEEATDCGIVITRHSFRTYSARLSADVEFGFIQEVDLM